MTKSGGIWNFRGLRDPLAEAPAEILHRHELPAGNAQFELAPFWSLTPELVRRRATQRLAPPIGVTLRLDGETLIAEGSAPANWASQIRPIALALPGIGSFDTSRLLDNSERALVEARQHLETHTILFSEGTMPVDDLQAFEHLAADVRGLFVAAVNAKRPVIVELLGHTDRQGTPDLNQRLALQRAQAVATALEERGVPATQLRPISRGSLDASPGPANPKDRRVTLRVDLPEP